MNSVDPFHSGIESLFRRAVEGRRKNLEIVGTSDVTGLAAFLASIHLSQEDYFSHLVVVADNETAQKFKEDISFFAPDVACPILPTFDVSPYSGLFPNSRTISERLSWLNAALKSTAGSVFVSPIDSLFQKTLPKNVFLKNILKITVGVALPPSLTEALGNIGYFSTPLVEDVGHFSIRGGILDVFSPAHERPVRIELFGDVVDSLRFFDPETQRTIGPCEAVDIIPAREIIFNSDTRQRAATAMKKNCELRGVPKKQYESALQQLARGEFFNGVDYLLSGFYESLALPISYFERPLCVWLLDSMGLMRATDDFQTKLKSEAKLAFSEPIFPEPSELYAPHMSTLEGHTLIRLSKIKVSLAAGIDEEEDALANVVYKSQPVLPGPKGSEQNNAKVVTQMIHDWKTQGYQVYISAPSPVKRQRLKSLFQDSDINLRLLEDSDFQWQLWGQEQTEKLGLVHVLPRPISQNYHFQEEKIVILDESFLLGTKKSRSKESKSQSALDKVRSLSFADLKVGDLIVHIEHGIGFFDGLKKLSIQGVDSEFIALRYKDNDKLYLPVYRIEQIQKFSGPSSQFLIDRLGSGSFEQTKIKVRSKLRDVAADLLKLYAARQLIGRPPMVPIEQEYFQFEAAFPYDETADQEKTIRDILKDFSKKTPMDRLICGDVGFGKTEVAMRAAFVCVQNKKLAVNLAPTTVLTYQHFETFKRRFAGWPVEIRLLNRFVSRTDVNKTLKELAAGKVDILIGTHRVLSKDVSLSNLGLMVVDEEHKFGVIHKEKIRQMCSHIDTLAMSATPIPRTLNMSLVGIRDISLISTAPVDRLPVRTFICKFDEETVKKAVRAELARGGQIFFVHNRIESIFGVHDRLKEFLPDVKISVAHGQMEAKQLEDIIVAFFKKEIDILLCTTIIESGMDIPNANTMFIDRAETFGLSQLYQLRGRIGRSKKRAYCYLLLPDSGRLEKEAQERLKVIQENTALGSGFKVAHYDLELRGAGNILGEDQSGHISSVGFELYYELLEEALHTARGEPPIDLAPEPDINIKIPALIPDTYISDIRIRLAYYKSLSRIKTHEDIDHLEDELRDQFGAVPEVTANLMGLMLVRSIAKVLRLRDLSSGLKSISLAFTDKTPMPSNEIVRLASLPNKKFSLTKDNRLNIRMNEITWPNIFEELTYLTKLCPTLKTLA
ncbi:MAG: transcription-repair coupling factor [Pseudomonadota bacterium]|nr:transcription-repair coupling factor [Pseudomonadota bacterium]